MTKGKFRDLTGQMFGKLTVIERAPNSEKQQVQWLCECECGNRKVIRAQSLTRGRTKSCGCSQYDRGVDRRDENIQLYNSWQSMRKRCGDPKHVAYHRYGGRGITVCDEWNDFKTFKQWAMENGYKKGLTIDRIDVDKGYYPDNCRWITRSENSRRKEVNGNERFITIGDQTKSISQWARETGIDYNTLRGRMNAGWPPERLLLPDQRKKQDYILTSPDGDEYIVTNLRQFCEEHGLSWPSLHHVLNKYEGATQHKGWKIVKLQLDGR